MSEQKLQSKILKWLQRQGCYTVKVVSATKAGVPDIIGCLPNGEFFAIEVKWLTGKPSPLQLHNISQIHNAKGIAFVAWDLETVQTTLRPFLPA